jgi:UDP-N-acetylglucosamine 2-epimerase (non-hydrolysing)/GDP/UDP-N,N'-diacetylbacillosamine 2-epimerase (hydrolysing)
MAGRRRICVVTGSRAEYGLLYWLIRDLHEDPDIELQLVATGMHLSPEFGLTHRVIEEDGFRIDERVEMLVSSDTPTGVAKSIGLGVAGFADAFARLAPEIIVVLGDRFEILAAAQAALVAGIPLAHIAGGDTTEGSYDEAIRHSITKMAHLHFVTNEVAARRVRQMGEEPARIHNFGSPGIDGIRRMTLVGREELARDLECEFAARNLLITFHPVTLEPGASEKQFGALLAALGSLGPDVGLFFTMPNADTGGRRLAAMVQEFVASHSRARAYVSLGQARYLSLMAEVDAVVGNSSSGLYEAPSLKKPTVNIGDRQTGRLLAASVINCEPETDAIVAAIKAAFLLDCTNTVNPYGDGHASERIAAVLKRIPDPRALLRKRFYMPGEAHG